MADSGSVVADSAPLIALAAIGEFWLLRRLWGHLLIPPTVYDEVVTHGAGRPGVVQVRDARWVEQRVPLDGMFVRALLRDLDRGESEALVLAREVGARFVLVDERAARRFCVELGLIPVGTLGVLLRAKEHGLIASIRDRIDRLSEAGFYLSEGVKQEVLNLASESDSTV